MHHSKWKYWEIGLFKWLRNDRNCWTSLIGSSRISPYPNILRKLPCKDMIIFRLPTIPCILACERTECLNYSADSEMTDTVEHPWPDPSDYFHALTPLGVPGNSLIMIWSLDFQSPSTAEQMEVQRDWTIQVIEEWQTLWDIYDQIIQTISMT